MKSYQLGRIDFAVVTMRQVSCVMCYHPALVHLYRIMEILGEGGGVEVSLCEL